MRFCILSLIVNSHFGTVENLDSWFGTEASRILLRNYSKTNFDYRAIEFLVIQYIKSWLLIVQDFQLQNDVNSNIMSWQLRKICRQKNLICWFWFTLSGWISEANNPEWRTKGINQIFSHSISKWKTKKEHFFTSQPFKLSNQSCQCCPFLECTCWCHKCYFRGFNIFLDNCKMQKRLILQTKKNKWDFFLFFFISFQGYQDSIINSVDNFDMLADLIKCKCELHIANMVRR